MIDLSDPISRQQTITALRALSDADGYINAPHEVVTDVVRGLPPVRAEQGQTVHSEQGDSDKLGVKTGETCEDCISRQAAIDAMANTLWHYPNECYRNLNVYEFAKGLAELGLKSVPSAQPEIIRCKDCKYRDENWRRVSVRWLPCMDMKTGSNWYCGSAERREDE